MKSKYKKAMRLPLQYVHVTQPSQLHALCVHYSLFMARLLERLIGIMEFFSMKKVPRQRFFFADTLTLKWPI